jgi:hypothetical protein
MIKSSNSISDIHVTLTLENMATMQTLGLYTTPSEP